MTFLYKKEDIVKVVDHYSVEHVEFDKKTNVASSTAKGLVLGEVYGAVDLVQQNLSNGHYRFDKKRGYMEIQIDGLNDKLRVDSTWLGYGDKCFFFFYDMAPHDYIYRR